MNADKLECPSLLTVDSTGPKLSFSGSAVTKYDFKDLTGLLHSISDPISINRPQNKAVKHAKTSDLTRAPQQCHYRNLPSMIIVIPPEGMYYVSKYYSRI